MSESYSFRLEINHAASVKEIAGELWNIAKNLREGTIQQKYGNDLTPLRVDYEVRQITQEMTSSSSATASVGPDGKPVTSSESTAKTITKEFIQTSNAGNGQGNGQEKVVNESSAGNERNKQEDN